MADPIRINALNQVGRANKPELQPAPVFYNYSADFSVAANIVFDFNTINQNNIFGVPKSVFVDNGTNPEQVDVSVSITGQTFTVPAYAQGVFSLNATISSDITFETLGGASGRSNITIYNFDVAPQVWYSFGTFNFDKPLATFGTMAEGDDVATSANNNPVYMGGIDRATGEFRGVSVDGGGVQFVNAIIDSTTPVDVNVTNQPVLQGGYTDRSIANLSGASEQLMPANAARRVLVISNVSANTIGVNLTGGVAAIGVAGTLTLLAGASLTIDQYPPTSAINVIGTATDDVTAYEG